MKLNSTYLHLLYRCNAIFLLLGSVIVPSVFMLDIRAAFFALWIIYFGWPWGIASGTLFGLTIIYTLKHLSKSSMAQKRSYWLAIGLLLGLFAGVLISGIYSFNLLLHTGLFLEKTREIGPIQTLVRTMVIPSAVCGCVCAGWSLYPSLKDIGAIGYSSDWNWVDFVFFIPLFTIAIGFYTLK